MKKFTEWLNESTLNEANVADLFRTTSNWINISRNNVSDTIELHTRFEVLKWLTEQFPYITEFKIPPTTLNTSGKNSTSKQDLTLDFYPIYVIVDKAHGSCENRNNMYKEIYNTLYSQEPVAIRTIKKQTKYIWLGDEANAKQFIEYNVQLSKDGKFEIQNNKWKLNQNKLNSTTPTDNVLYLSILSLTETDENYKIQSIIPIRICNDVSTENKTQCKIKNASGLLSTVFNGNVTTVKKGDKIERYYTLYNKRYEANFKTGLNEDSFQNRLISSIKHIINDDTNLEYKCYSVLFEQDISTTFNPTAEWEKIKLSDDITVPDFVYNSNISKVLSEIYIPWLLINGAKDISGVPVIKKISGKSNVDVKSIDWPTSQTNVATDFNICFANLSNGERVGISAKSGSDGGNASSVISVIANNLDASSVKLTKSPLFKHITDNMRYARDNIKKNKVTNPLYCWIIGATCFNGKLTGDDILCLCELYYAIAKHTGNILTYSDLNKFDLTPNVIKLLNKVHDKFKTDKYFPYSLTVDFEKIAVEKLMENKTDLGCIYNLKMRTFEENSGMKFYQIEMMPNQTGFDIKLIQNKSNSNNFNLKELGELIKLETVGGNGNTKNYKTAGDCVSILKQSGIGNGQLLGATFKEKK